MAGYGRCSWRHHRSPRDSWFLPAKLPLLTYCTVRTEHNRSQDSAEVRGRPAPRSPHRNCTGTAALVGDRHRIERSRSRCDGDRRSDRAGIPMKEYGPPLLPLAKAVNVAGSPGQSVSAFDTIAVNAGYNCSTTDLRTGCTTVRVGQRNRVRTGYRRLKRPDWPYSSAPLLKSYSRECRRRRSLLICVDCPMHNQASPCVESKQSGRLRDRDAAPAMVQPLLSVTVTL